MPLVLISLAVIILDRVTKILVQSHLAEGAFPSCQGS